VLFEEKTRDTGSVNVAHASGHRVVYGQEQLQEMRTGQRAPEQARDDDLGADAWELVSEIIEQIKVEQEDVDEAKVEMEILDDGFRAVLQSEGAIVGGSQLMSTALPHADWSTASRPMTTASPAFYPSTPSNPHIHAQLPATR